MSLRSGIIQVRLLAVTITALFFVSGCASQNSTRTPDERISLERAFLNGDASLTCELVCSGMWGASRRNLKKLYEQQQWNDLAAGVHKIGFNTDLSWLYLGRSAEGLGYIQAARIYYLKALSVEKKCKTILLDNCDNLDVPSLASDRLARLGGASTVTDLLPQQRYDAAFALAQRGDYDGAERAFLNFLSQYPKHPFTANAQYALGEIAFSQRKDFARAAKTFGDAYKVYPKHAKAPDMLSKLGASLGQLGMKDQACRSYALLFSEHPGMPDQVRLVATNDSLRLGCGGAPVQSQPAIRQQDVAAQKDKALALYGQVRCKNIHNFEWTTTGSCPDGATQVAPTVAQSPSQSWASSGNSKASVPAEKVPHPAKHQQGEPPRILIDSMPSTTSGQIIHVVGRVLSKGKITSLMINDTEISFQPDGKFSVPRGLSLGDSEFRLVAIDEWGKTGETSVKVTRTIDSKSIAAIPLLAPNQAKSKPRPKGVALIIGVERYQSAPSAEFAENDARRFYDYAINALGIPRDRVKLLTGTDARRLDIQKAVRTWVKPLIAKGQSDVFVFFSGHGLSSEDGSNLFLMPYDGESALLEESAIRRKDLVDGISEAGAASTTLFLDTCYSGGTRGKESLVASARPILVTAKEQAVPPNVTILAAAGNDQLSSSLAAAKHGLFSYFLMKGLEGEAAGPDRTITAAKLEAYLAENITVEAAKLGRAQTPQLIGDGSRVISSW